MFISILPSVYSLVLSQVICCNGRLSVTHCICKASVWVWKASSLLVLLCGSPCCKWPCWRRPKLVGKALSPSPHVKGIYGMQTPKVLQDWDLLFLKFSLHYVASVLRTALNWKPLPHTQYIGSRCTVNWKISFKTRLHIAWSWLSSGYT